MPMYSACGNAVLPALGFPIRESADHRLFSAYPRLIAAVHALHRLLVPRHPPCALPILTVITRTKEPRKGGSAEHAVIPVCWHGCAVFKVREEGARPDWARGLSKLNSMGRHVGAPRSGRHFGSHSSCAGAECAGRRATAPILELP